MRIPSLSILAGLIALGLSACMAPDAGSPSGHAAEDNATPSATLSTRLLREQSCPQGTRYETPRDILIDAKPVSLGQTAGRKLSPGVLFAGGWELTSPNKQFGGLSGIEILDDGTFLTVSDTGAFVWIDRTDGRPNGAGRLSYMLGQNGQMLSGKADGDSEGLALHDGLVFVSFERQHRIEAFDLDRCGSAARAAHVTRLPDTLNGTAIRENSGAEALSYSNGLVAGYEQLIDKQSPLVRVGASADTISWKSPAPGADADPLVGMTNTVDLGDASMSGSVTYSLRRDFTPLFGNRLTVEAEYRDAGGFSQRTLFALSAPMTVDNFEGLTVETLSDGTHRLWMVSDDNFSDRQRTLLYAFDLVGEAH